MRGKGGRPRIVKITYNAVQTVALHLSLTWKTNVPSVPPEVALRIR